METDAQPAGIVDWVCQIARVMKEAQNVDV